VTLEEEPSWGPFPPLATGLGALSALAAGLVLRGRRIAGALAALVAVGGLVDEIGNGPGWYGASCVAGVQRSTSSGGRAMPEHPARSSSWRTTTRPRRGATSTSDPGRALYERAPDLVGRMRTGPPQWWAVVGGPS
jgi:hypothetical protein